MVTDGKWLNDHSLTDFHTQNLEMLSQAQLKINKTEKTF